MRNVLALILGGGQGSRLHPLTELRSKPAVPIGGKYRLIDVPISNCLHADLRRIFVLTQFNSASLNRHVSSTFRMDQVLARVRRHPRGRADATVHELVPGHRRRRAQGPATFPPARRGLLPDPGRRPSLPDGLRRAPQAHQDRQADITIAALPVDAEDATGMGIFTFDAQGGIAGFEEKPNRDRLAHMRPEPWARAPGFRRQTRAARTSRRWASISSRARCCWICSSSRPATTSAASSFPPPSPAIACTRSHIATTGPMSAPSAASTTRTSC